MWVTMYQQLVIKIKVENFLKTQVCTSTHSTSQQSNDFTCYVTMESLTAHLWENEESEKKKLGFYHEESGTCGPGDL